MRADLIHGDALAILPGIAARCVDLVYLDPPYGNQQVWTGKAGSFSDKWKWTPEVARELIRLRTEYPVAADLIDVAAVPQDLKAYLVFMARLLIACRRCLRLTGSLWLQCDDTAGAYLHVIGATIFRPDHVLGQVIWKRTSARSSTRNFARVHDTIHAFARSRAAHYRLARCSQELAAGDPIDGMQVGGFVDERMGSVATERVGYPTQKPVALLEPIIRTATLPGDLVLDPVCGSGTTLVAARSLGRPAIGIDRSEDAINAARRRLGSVPPRQLDMLEAA